MTGALRGSGRTAALRLAADTAQVLGDVANGRVVEPSRLRDLTLRLVQGGGIQKKFAELMLPCGGRCYYRRASAGAEIAK